MELTSITQERKNDQIVEAMLGRENEYWNYQLNKNNYVHMIEQLSAGDERVVGLNTMLADTEKQMAVVDSVYHALESQIEGGVAGSAYAASLARIQAKTS